MTERWTTFWALLVAAARVVKRHRRLLIFPALLLLGVAGLYTLAYSPFVMAHFVPGVNAPSTPFPLWSLLLWSVAIWYLGQVTATLVAVAVSDAALQALRGDRVSVREALVSALDRLHAVLGFALVAGTLGAPASAIERRSQWVVRAAMAVFGASWTLVSLFAIVAMTGERLGTVSALRRGTTLLRASWAEGRLTPLGLGLLWVPLVAAQAAAVWWAGRGDVLDRNSAVLASIVVNVVLWVGFWLLERVYVAAVYCYAVEGVVPAPFQDEALAEFWQAAARPPALAPDRPVARPRIAPVSNRRTAIGVAAGLIAGLGYLAWSAHESGAFALYFPKEGVPIDARSFEPGPRLIATHTIGTGDGLSGITSVRTDEGPRILLFGGDRLLKLGPNLERQEVVPLPLIAENIGSVEALELAPGRGIVVGINSSRLARGFGAVMALDWNGLVLFHRSTPGGNAINAIAPVRVGPDWGVAVGYTGGHGLCYLDSNGQERWCNQDVGRAWVVSSMDCTGDQQPEIVSHLPRAAGRKKLGCYTLAGQRVGDLAIGREPLALRAIDLDDDGGGELAFVDHQVNNTGVIGIWRTNGTLQAEVHVTEPPGRMLSMTTPIAARRTGGGPRDVVVLGPQGQLLGVSLTGERWRAGQDIEAFTAIDLDGDGSEEVITLGKRVWKNRVAEHAIGLWSWTRQDPAWRQTTTYAPGVALPLPRSALALHPIRPYAGPLGEQRPTLAELDYRLGCYVGVGAALSVLPTLVQRDRLSEDLKRCEDALTDLDLSSLLPGNSMSWLGCIKGVQGTFERYEVGEEPGQRRSLFNDCWREVQGKTPPGKRPGARAAAEYVVVGDLQPALFPTSVAWRLLRDHPSDEKAMAMLPAKLRQPGVEHSRLYRVCASSAGRVTRADLEFDIEKEEVDGPWLDALRSSQFRPFEIAGTPIPFCTTVHISARARPPLTATGGPK